MASVRLWVLDGLGAKALELLGSSPISGDRQLARSSVLLLGGKYPGLLSVPPVQQFSEVRLVRMIPQDGVKPVWIIKALNPQTVYSNTSVNCDPGSPTRETLR